MTRKIKTSWWVDFRVDGVRYRRRSPENSKAGASAYEAVLRSKLARGEPLDAPAPKPSIPTFREFAATFFETYVKSNNRPAEQYTKSIYLNRHLVPAFGSLPLSDITSQHVERYKASKRSQGQSEKSVNNHLAVLSKCLHCAAEWGVIPAVPPIRFLRVPPSSFDHLTPEEGMRLINASGGVWRAMITVGLRTGLRFGELVGLRWEDVSLERSVISVRRSVVKGVVGAPKNNRIRYVPLTLDAIEALTALSTERVGYIFSSLDGRPIARSRAHRALSKICAAASLRHIGWHVLRHTFASQLTAAGVPTRTVQELMGHADIKMTERYTHLAPSTMREAVNILDLLAKEKVGQPVGNRTEMAYLSTGKADGEKVVISSNLPKKKHHRSDAVSLAAGLGLEPR